MQNSNIPNPLLISGTFIGFLYASCISLTIVTGEKYGIFGQVDLTLYVVFVFMFITQDWWGRQLVLTRILSEKMPITPELILKSIVDVLVLFSLVLFSLSFISELSSIKNSLPENQANTFITPSVLLDAKSSLNRSLWYVTTFAFLSAIWSWMSIYFENKRTDNLNVGFVGITRFLVFSETPKKWMELFPHYNSIYQRHQKETAKTLKIIDGQDTSISTVEKDLRDHRKRINNIFGGNMLSKNLLNPFTPYYLLLAQSLVGNIALGFFIFISIAFNNSESLLSIVGHISFFGFNDVGLEHIIITFLVFYTMMFAFITNSIKSSLLKTWKDDSSKIETTNKSFTLPLVLISIFPLYIFCPAPLLIVLLFSQQALSNLFMAHYYKVGNGNMY